MKHHTLKAVLSDQDKALVSSLLKKKGEVRACSNCGGLDLTIPPTSIDVSIGMESLTAGSYYHKTGRYCGPRPQMNTLLLPVLRAKLRHLGRVFYCRDCGFEGIPQFSMTRMHMRNSSFTGARNTTKERTNSPPTISLQALYGKEGSERRCLFFSIFCCERPKD